MCKGSRGMYRHPHHKEILEHHGANYIKTSLLSLTRIKSCNCDRANFLFTASCVATVSRHLVSNQDSHFSHYGKFSVTNLISDTAFTFQTQRSQLSKRQTAAA